MTTPPPTPVERRVEDHRAQLLDLTTALQSPSTPFVRTVLLDAVLGVFERTAALVAPPRGISDASGDESADVEQALFVEPAQAELMAMPRALNGIEVNA